MANDPSIKTASFLPLWHSWPRVGTSELCQTLGGNVAEAQKRRGTDDAALRLSVAMIRSGHPLTSSSSYTGETLTDAAGFVYILDPLEWKHELTHKLGKPRNVAGKGDILGRKGVLLFERVRRGAGVGGATNVLQLWNGEETVSSTPE